MWGGVDCPVWARDACSALANELQSEFIRQVTGFRQEVEDRVEKLIDHIASFEGYAEQSLGKLEKVTKSREDELAERVACLEERLNQLVVEKSVSQMAIASLRTDLDRMEAARETESASGSGSGSDITTTQQVEIFAAMEEAIRALRHEHDEIVASSGDGFLRLEMQMDSLGAGFLAHGVAAGGALDPWMMEQDERQYHTAAIVEQLREVMSLMEKTFDDRLTAVERTFAAGNVIANHCYASGQERWAIIPGGNSNLPEYWSEKEVTSSGKTAFPATIGTLPPGTLGEVAVCRLREAFENVPQARPRTAEDVRYALGAGECDPSTTAGAPGSAAIRATAALLEEVLRQLCPSPAAHQAVLSRLVSRLSVELAEQQC